MKKIFNAFTLAEVLITLAIIAVVAVITIPSLINNYKKQVLAAQFKKSVSAISQAILFTKNDLGIENLAGYCTTLNNSYINASSCYESFEKNFARLLGKRKHAPGGYTLYDINREKETIKTYNNKQTVTFSALAGPYEAIFYTQMMPDGSYFNMHIDEGYLYIGVDINGATKPNKLGHDIFLFYIDEKKDTLTYFKPENLSDEEIENGEYTHEYQKERKGNPCNTSSNQKANGIGCAYYALRNTCPYETEKSYFECLP